VRDDIEHHEERAMQALVGRGGPDHAMVHATLALAAGVERFAAAAERIASALEASPPPS
jgi:hypothetical protein